MSPPPTFFFFFSFLSPVPSSVFVAGLKSDWAILHLGCNNVHCDTRGGPADTWPPGGVRSMMFVRACVCVCVFFFVRLGSLGIHMAFWGLRGGVCFCHWLLHVVLTRHYQCTRAHVFLSVAHDTDSAIIPCTKTVWPSWTILFDFIIV